MSQFFDKSKTVKAIMFGGLIAFSWLVSSKVGYFPSLKNFLGFSTNAEQTTTQRLDLLNYDRPLNQLLDSNSDLSQTKILVEKAQKRLTIYYQEQLIKSYPIVLGGNPVGDKRQEGDQKTPEGIFKVRDLYPHPRWSKFIWLDYPTPQSWEKHRAAKEQGIIPVSATIGGEIGIHGVPKGRNHLVDEGKNWTLGCVSLKNQDVDEIYNWIQVGTVIEIRP